MPQADTGANETHQQGGGRARRGVKGRREDVPAHPRFHGVHVLADEKSYMHQATSVVIITHHTEHSNKAHARCLQPKYHKRYQQPRRTPAPTRTRAARPDPKYLRKKKQNYGLLETLIPMIYYKINIINNNHNIEMYGRFSYQ